MSNKFICKKSKKEEDCTIVFTSESPIYFSSDDYIKPHYEEDDKKLTIIILGNVTFDILSSTPIRYEFNDTKGDIKVRKLVTHNSKKNSLEMYNVTATPNNVKKKLEAFILEVNIVKVNDDFFTKGTIIGNGIISVRKSGDKRIIELNNNPIYTLDLSVLQKKPVVNCIHQLKYYSDNLQILTKEEWLNVDKSYQYGCNIDEEYIFPKDENKFIFLFFKNNTECIEFAKLFDEKKQDSEVSVSALKQTVVSKPFVKENVAQHNVRAKLSTSAKNSCKAISNYRNNGFSCYYDSLFFALFAFPSNFISAHLFTKKQDVHQETFQIIFQYLHHVSLFNENKDHCQLLPKELLIDPEHPNAQEDASDLLYKIFIRLNITTLTQTIIETFQKKESESKETIVNESEYIAPIILIDTQNISANGTDFIITTSKQDFYHLPKHLESKPKQLKKDRKAVYDSFPLAKSDREQIRNQSKALTAFNAIHLPEGERKDFRYYLIETNTKYNLQGQQFIVFRNNGLQNTDINRITNTVNQANNSLYLNQIVCRSGDEDGKAGHYVCYFRCNQNWYLYNDAEDQTIIQIGSKLNIQDGYTWTLLFYNEVNPIKPQA